MSNLVLSAMGIVVMLVVAWIGYLHTRMGEQSRESDARDRDLWSALNEHKRDYQQFRGEMLRDMVTKQDLHEMEARLLAAFKASAR